jgi:Tfp pilus assembly protein PilP
MIFVPRALLAPMLLLALTACSQEAEPQTRASAADRAACRQRVEEVYNKQNRAEMYQTDTYMTSTRDAPFATSGVAMPNTGLSSRYAHDTMVSDCLRSVSGNVGTSPEPAAAASP